MDLQAIELSRLVALFRATRKAGQLYLPAAVQVVSKRYGFSKFPESFEELTGDKVVFKHGLFKDAAIETLEVYNDGIIIETRSDTRIVDDFFDDLCSWMTTDVGLSLVKTHTIDRMYESHLLVHSERDLLGPLSSFHEMVQALGNELKTACGLEAEFVPFGIGFATDLSQVPGLKPTNFRLERWVGGDFSLNLYLSAAPLKTQQHFSLLQMMERG